MLRSLREHLAILGTKQIAALALFQKTVLLEQQLSCKDKAATPKNLLDLLSQNNTDHSNI